MPAVKAESGAQW